MMKHKHPYEDILDLPHPVSPFHPPMSPADRAAQFAPFAALTGHEAAIWETARLTEERIELSEDRKAELDAALRFLQENLSLAPEVSVIYFLPDTKKAGGAYATATGQVKKIDEYARSLLMTDRTEIPIEDIWDIELKYSASR